MNPFLTFVVTFLGGVCGYVIGRQQAVDVSPILRQKSEQIRELQARNRELHLRLAEQDWADEQDGLVETIPEEVQVEILESWIRK